MTVRLLSAALLLAAAAAGAFPLETSARVEIVPHVEISVASPANPIAEGGGMRLNCPDDVAAHVELVTDDGAGRFRQVAFAERGDAWVRWDEDLMSCRLTVTIE